MANELEIVYIFCAVFVVATTAAAVVVVVVNDFDIFYSYCVCITMYAFPVSNVKEKYKPKAELCAPFANRI